MVVRAVLDCHRPCNPPVQPPTASTLRLSRPSCRRCWRGCASRRCCMATWTAGRLPSWRTACTPRWAAPQCRRMHGLLSAVCSWPRAAACCTGRGGGAPGEQGVADALQKGCTDRGWLERCWRVQRRRTCRLPVHPLCLCLPCVALQGAGEEPGRGEQRVRGVPAVRRRHGGGPRAAGHGGAGVFLTDFYIFYLRSAVFCQQASLLGGA